MNNQNKAKIKTKVIIEEEQQKIETTTNENTSVAATTDKNDADKKDTDKKDVDKDAEKKKKNLSYEQKQIEFKKRREEAKERLAKKKKKNEVRLNKERRYPGLVRAVISGDTMIIIPLNDLSDVNGGDIEEITFTLNGVKAPLLERKTRVDLKAKTNKGKDDDKDKDDDKGKADNKNKTVNVNDKGKTDNKVKVTIKDDDDGDDDDDGGDDNNNTETDRNAPIFKKEKDEAFAWDSREYLRRRLVGKTVIYRIENQDVNTSKCYGEIWLFENDEPVNVRDELVRNGWVEVSLRKYFEEKKNKTILLPNWKAIMTLKVFNKMHKILE